MTLQCRALYRHSLMSEYFKTIAQQHLQPFICEVLKNVSGKCYLQLHSVLHALH